MQIKRFEGRDIQEALRQVKEELGPEAIILSTQKVKKPSYRFGFSSPSRVEVVAAIDRGVDPIPKANTRSPSDKESQKTEEEGMILRILSTGLYPDFVHGLVKEIRTLRDEFEDWNHPGAYRGFLHWKLMENVEVAVPSLNQTQIWSFIGPTGVGKTTTMVKLAAHFSLKVTPKVTLITIDTYRIGAIEQLKAYAQILGLPLEVAFHREELREIIERNIDQDLMLIDTAGRSPNATGEIEELKDFLSVDPRIENHLILSATTKESDLEGSVQRFSLLPIKSYIFTKLDETEEYIPLFNQLLRYKRPLSYLTKGQRVPEDIELATKANVANLVLNTIHWN
jgi:flagellar biosynthesis protein FlhF